MYFGPCEPGHWLCHSVAMPPLLRLLMDSFVSFCWVRNPESGSNLTGIFDVFCGCEVGEWKGLGKLGSKDLKPIEGDGFFMQLK